MYKIARNEAGMSMEEASFKLHIGRRTLSNYENGLSPVPNEIVFKMALVYKKPELLVDHCAKNCPIGQITAQTLHKRNMSVSVLGFLKEFEDVSKLKNRLIEIASDGELDDTEIPDFMNFLREVRKLKKAIGEIEQFAMRRIGIESTLEKDVPMQALG